MQRDYTTHNTPAEFVTLESATFKTFKKPNTFTTIKKEDVRYTMILKYYDDIRFSTCLMQFAKAGVWLPEYSDGYIKEALTILESKKTTARRREWLNIASYFVENSNTNGFLTYLVK